MHASSRLLIGMIFVCSCQRTAAPSGATQLILNLPDVPEYKGYQPPRNASLTIDGKDVFEPGQTRRALLVQPEKGKDSITIVFSYWPVSHQNIIRTRVVKITSQAPISLDLSREDPSRPDVIKAVYVPTPSEVVQAMCRLASIGDKDVVYDIGCGDGRLVITAVDTFNARRGLGIDIDPQLVELSKKNSARAGTGDRVAFRQQDALAIEDFSEATVVFLYLSDELNMRLRPVLRRTLKPGARIVSHRFRMGDWKPDASGGDHDLYLWNIER